jgi:hypothetical protein
MSLPTAPSTFLLRCSDHHRQRARGRAGRTPTDRRVDDVDALFCHYIRHLDQCSTHNGRRTDERGTGLHARQQTTFARDNGLDLIAIEYHDEHKVRSFPDLLRRPGNVRAQRLQLSQRFRADVVCAEGMPVLEDVLCHAHTHVTNTDKSNVCH